jgi:uncharacterized membrane protein YdjX (TVP38/TMEM64 family)
VSETERPLLDDGEDRDTEQDESKHRHEIVKKTVAAIVIIGLIYAAFEYKDQVSAAKDQLFEACKHLGYFAVVFLFVLCVLTTSVCGPSLLWYVPGSVMFFQMYGESGGLIAGMVSSCPGVWLGSIGAFLLGRKYLKPKVQHIIDENEPLRIINEVIKKEGWQFAFMMRLNPLIPFELLNMACSMTNLSVGEYAKSCFGTMPVVMFEVYSSVAAAQMARGDGKSEFLETIVKLLVGLVLIVLMALYAKRKYDQEAAVAGAHSLTV